VPVAEGAFGAAAAADEHSAGASAIARNVSILLSDTSISKK
jgi:hypothetical protein